MELRREGRTESPARMRTRVAVSSSSDSRTDTSSSTTKTIDATSGMLKIPIEFEAMGEVPVYGGTVNGPVLIGAATSSQAPR